MAAESMGIECLFIIGKLRWVKELLEMLSISATGYTTLTKEKEGYAVIRSN
jgi:hypothetical protein